MEAPEPALAIGLVSVALLAAMAFLGAGLGGEERLLAHSAGDPGALRPVDAGWSPAVASSSGSSGAASPRAVPVPARCEGEGLVAALRRTSGLRLVLGPAPPCVDDVR